jgi:uncharacterized C2H2 Zn-finger protein
MITILCPKCKKTFEYLDAFKEHYTKEHSEYIKEKKK